MTESADKQPDKAKPEQYDYVSHNYEAMNRAIDTQVDKQFELGELYRFQQTSRRTMMLMHISISLCVIALTATLIWWLISPKNSLPGNTELSGYSLSSIFDTSTHDALKTISKVESTPNNPEQAFINTSFTVFHRSLTPTGEYVVTGKTYQPDNLRSPEEQYCYLEKDQQGGNLSGSPLAYEEKGKIILETQDEALIAFARQYCQFSR
jgi:hypothetical protein